MTAHEKLLDMGYKCKKISEFTDLYEHKERPCFLIWKRDKTVTIYEADIKLLQIILERCKELGWTE